MNFLFDVECWYRKSLIICCSGVNACVDLAAISLHVLCLLILNFMYAILNEIVDVSQLDTNQKATIWSHKKHAPSQTHMVYLRSPYSISGESRTQVPKNVSLLSTGVHHLSSFTTLPLKLSQTMRIWRSQILETNVFKNRA